MDFVAIDVETANADMSSICQIGLVFYQAGRVVDTWESLVNPCCSFSWMNIQIHGIEEEMVADAPDFTTAFDEFRHRIEGQVMASHMPFDCGAMTKAIALAGLPALDCQWIDTAKVARRTWEEFAKRGYGLKNIAQKFDIQFNHHDALEDAKACGEILMKAHQETAMDLQALMKRTTQPIKNAIKKPAKKSAKRATAR